MWQKFTLRARQAIFYTQEEARRLCGNDVSTEHLLLGLLRESDNVASHILGGMGVYSEQIHATLEPLLTQGTEPVGENMQLSREAARAIDFAYDETISLENRYIGTEHLLLGLIREQQGLAGRVLRELGIDLERTRQEVKRLQDAEPRPSTRPNLPTGNNK